MANKASSNVGLVDRSIASLSGSSQLLMAENETRGALYIMNVAPGTGQMLVTMLIAPR